MCVYVRMYWVYKENGTILPWTIPRAFKTCSSKLNFFGLRFLAALGVVQVLGPVVWNQARGAPETDGSGLV